MHCLASLGRCSSGGSLLRPAAYHTGQVTSPAKAPSPRRILPVSCMGGLLGGAAHRLLAEVELALLLALHHQGVRDELADAGHLDLRCPELADGRERGAI